MTTLDVLGGRKGITNKFRYHSLGVQILLGIIRSTSGMNVLDFANEYLFKPLGIVPRSKKEMSDFYNSICGFPVAGATLPVCAFILLGVYGRNVFLIVSTIILGIGHIGIHASHYKNIKSIKNNEL